MDDACTRLATYGTLAPGKPNHHQLAGLDGRWLEGHVRGSLEHAGWAAEMGYPGIRLDFGGDAIRVSVFESPDLPLHWQRLDAFEGPAYRRVVVVAQTDEGPLRASIYELAVGMPVRASNAP
jgi:gamma-glutamylcyclotransferase (GGCT)/AIG2-like uncharacterized protein YtfP